MREARKVKEVNNMTVLITLAVVFYCVSALSIGALVTIIFDRADIYSPKTILIMSIFWIIVIPVESIYIMMTKKGNAKLTDVLEVMGL